MNNSDQKRLRAKVHDELNIFYEPLGYKLNKSNGVFYKDGMEIFWGVVKKNIDAIYFQPTLSIQNIEIANVKSLLFGNEDLVISKLAGFRIANEFDNHDYDYLNIQDIDQGTGYKAEPDSKIIEIVNHHAEYMNKVGFAFFQKMITLDGIDDFINGRVLKGSDSEFIKNMKESYIARFYSKREVISGLITSYLLLKPETTELLKRYKIMFDGNDYILDDVIKVIDYFNK